MRLILIFLSIVVAFVLGVFSFKMLKDFRSRSDLKMQDIRGVSAKKKFPTKGKIVQIGDETVSADDVEWEYKMHTAGAENSEDLSHIPELGSRYAEQLEPLKQMILASIIERKIILAYIDQETDFEATNTIVMQECTQRWNEYIKAADEIEFDEDGKRRLRARMCEKAGVEMYLKEKVFPKVTVSDEEIRKYYDENKQSFRKPDQIIIRQIVLPSEDEAKRIKKMAKKDNFAELAQQYSIAPEASEGGLLPPFSRGQMPSVFDVAFELREGEIRGVLKSSYGYHIFLMEKFIRKREQTADMAKDEIATLLMNQKREKAYQDLVEAALNVVAVKPPQSLW